jgi:hypothetical protein
LAVLNKDLPEMWKLAIAKKIENNLLAKVPLIPPPPPDLPDPLLPLSLLFPNSITSRYLADLGKPSSRPSFSFWI